MKKPKTISLNFPLLHRVLKGYELRGINLRSKKRVLQLIFPNFRIKRGGVLCAVAKIIDK